MTRMTRIRPLHLIVMHREHLFPVARSQCGILSAFIRVIRVIRDSETKIRIIPTIRASKTKLATQSQTQIQTNNPHKEVLSAFIRAIRVIRDSETKIRIIRILRFSDSKPAKPKHPPKSIVHILQITCPNPHKHSHPHHNPNYNNNIKKTKRGQYHATKNL